MASSIKIGLAVFKLGLQRLQTTAPKSNKKSELMLMRRATASVYSLILYGNFRVVVLVYHSNFVKNSLYKCAKMTA